jgi:hypothetical protein
MLTAGFRWAPETAPMRRIMAIAMTPGATTDATRPTSPAFTKSAPAATRTRKNVPKNSQKAYATLA